jgi:Acetyltransferase (GNAT) domain
MKTVRRPLAEIPEDVLARLSEGAFFTSRGFAELWGARGGRPVAWTLEDDGAIAALLPGVEYGFGPFASFLSMPDGCYGGVLVDPALAAERPRFASALLAAVRQRGYARAWVFDFHRTLPATESAATSELETAVIDISDPRWAPPDAKLRSQARKAAREGIRVERFDWDRHGEAFLALVETTARRHHAVPRYGRAFYAALAQLARRDERVVWRWCAHDGRPACAHIYFVERGMLQAWQTYFDTAFSFLKPNPFIRIDTCRAQAARGVTRLNLGCTPSYASSLAYYKHRWGGERVTYPAWRTGALARPG